MAIISQRFVFASFSFALSLFMFCVCVFEQVEEVVIDVLQEGMLPMENLTLVSYNKYADTGAQSLGSLFLGSHASSGLIVISVKSSNTTFAHQTVKDMLFYLNSVIPSFDTRNGTYSVSITGYDQLVIDTLAATKKTFLWILCIIIPSAVVIVAVVVNSSILAVLVGIVLLANCCIVMAGVDVFGLYVTNINGFVAILSEIVCVALTVLYSFWFIESFNEHINKGTYTRRAAQRAFKASMLYTLQSLISFFVPCAAAIVFLSGVFRVMALFVLFSCILAYLSATFVIPSIIYIFSDVFALWGICPCYEQCRTRKGYDDQDEVREVRTSFYVFVLSELRESEWKLIPALGGIIAVMGIAVFQITQLKESYTMTDLVSTDTDSYKALLRINGNSGYPGSLLAPFYFMHEVTGLDHGILSDKGSFMVNSHFMQRTIETFQLLSSSNFVALSYFLGRHITWADACQYLDPTYQSDMGRSYRVLASGLTDSNKSVALTMVLPNDDPGTLAPSVLPMFKKLSSLTSKETNHTIIPVSQAFAMYGFIQKNLYMSLFVAVAAVFGSLILLGLASLAPIAGFVHVVCCVVTCSTAVGLCSLLFSSFPATSLVIAVPLLFGFSMTFQSFLYSYVTRYRRKGFGPDSSIIRGTFLSGKLAFFSVAFVAGCFALLFLSSVPMIRYISTVMMIMCALDVIFVRFFLHPALLLLWGKVNWFPKEPIIIYKRATSEDHGSQIIRYLDNSEAAEEEDEQDEAIFEKNLEKLIINSEQEDVKGGRTVDAARRLPDFDEDGLQAFAADDFDPVQVEKDDDEASVEEGFLGDND